MRFKCASCSYWARGTRDVRMHELRIHSELRPRKCSQHRAGTRSNVRDHIEVRHNPNLVKKFSCPFCPKTFYTKPGVDQHVKEAHLKEKPYKCDKCSYATVHPCRLKLYHGRKHGEFKRLEELLSKLEDECLRKVPYVLLNQFNSSH